jgi:hypothetical protein
VERALTTQVGWAPEPVWTFLSRKKNPCPCRKSNTVRSARSQSLYRNKVKMLFVLHIPACLHSIHSERSVLPRLFVRNSRHWSSLTHSSARLHTVPADSLENSVTSCAFCVPANAWNIPQTSLLYTSKSHFGGCDLSPSI